MAGRNDQWPQAVLAPWAWQAERGRAARWRDRVQAGDGGFLGSRAFVVSVVLTVAFVSVGLVGWTSGAFSSAAANEGNTFEASTDFCTAPGTQFVVANADSYVYQGSPNTNYGTDTSLYVLSSPNANVRTLVRFALPVKPAGCSMTAILALYSTNSTSGRTIQAYRAATAWTETGVTWNNQPAATGTPATLASGTTGWQTWSVTTLVQEQYSIGNNGFVLRDSVEDGPNAFQQWRTRTHSSTPPILVVTFE